LMCTCLIIMNECCIQVKEEKKLRQRVKVKYIRFVISSYCIRVLSQDERPISHLNKKINEKYMLTTGEKSIIDHI
jgi:hypothetical protein